MSTTSSIAKWCRNLSPRAAAFTIICIWVLVVVGILFWPGEFPFEHQFVEVARSDTNVLSAVLVVSMRQAHTALRFALLLCVSLVALAALAYDLRRQMFTPSRISAIFYWAATLGCCWTLFVCLSKHGYEGSWYPLGRVMHHPGTLAVFGRRLLMVWLAHGVQTLLPSLSDLRAFYLSQVVAIFFTTYAMGICVL